MLLRAHFPDGPHFVKGRFADPRKIRQICFEDSMFAKPGLPQSIAPVFDLAPGCLHMLELSAEPHRISTGLSQRISCGSIFFGIATKDVRLAGDKSRVPGSPRNDSLSWLELVPHSAIDRVTAERWSELKEK